MNLKLIFLLLICNVYCFSQQIIIPEGYVELKKSPTNGRKIETVSFKMDNDSENDLVMIVGHKEDLSKYKILIYLSSLNTQFERQYIDDDWEFEIYPNQLEVKNNVLTFSYFLSAGAFERILKLRYNEKQKKIQVIGYDSSYRIIDGDIKKSYNLLTGEYVVTKKTYETEEGETAIHQGSRKVNTVFLNDVNNQLFYKLDEAGSEFEDKE